jgi:magnesium-transporting ATPase (P-type)
LKFSSKRKYSESIYYETESDHKQMVRKSPSAIAEAVSGAEEDRLTPRSNSP